MTRGEDNGLSRAYFAAVSGGLALVAFLLVREFRWPILYPRDPAQYGFASFYFGENVRWLPVPRLSLETDWSFYPHGIDHVFLHWGFERDLWCSSLGLLFGPGPWQQLYFLLSVAIAALGTFALLRREIGAIRAAFVGAGASFLNFYALSSYPLHQPSSCAHWTLLGIVVDFVLVRRAVLSVPWTLRWLALRGVLLLLSLGLDLGYVAGYSWTSFSLAAVWCAVLFAWRRLRSTGAPADRVSIPGGARGRTGMPAFELAAWSTLAALAMWLYVPLTLDLARSVAKFDFRDVPGYVQWEHPLRIFVPVLPGLDPNGSGGRLDRFFGDRTESFTYHFAPGLSLVAAAAIGLVGSRRRVAIALPFLVLFLLLLFFDPRHFRTLHLFPWFEFARIPGRSSVVFSTVLALFAVGLGDRGKRPGGTRRPAWRVVALLLIAETGTAWASMTRLRSVEDNFRPDATFEPAMRLLREAPGEAVFEWPFSIAPSSGNLAAFHIRLGGTFQFAPYHRKKGMGFYFGRLHPDEIRRIESYGWQHLFFPELVRGSSRRQRRDFAPEEWEFIEEFVGSNDFAGVLLYPEVLPPETVAGFHRRFGPPAARTRFYSPIGEVHLLLRSPAWKYGRDAERGRALELVRPVFPLRPGEKLRFAESSSHDYLFEGWMALAKRERWSEATSAFLRFRLERLEDLTAVLRLGSRDREHEVKLLLNGVPIAAWRPPVGDTAEFRVAVPAELWRETNELEFRIPDATPVRSDHGWIHQGIQIRELELRAPVSGD